MVSSSFWAESEILFCTKEKELLSWPKIVFKIYVIYYFKGAEEKKLKTRISLNNSHHLRMKKLEKLGLTWVSENICETVVWYRYKLVIILLYGFLQITRKLNPLTRGFQSCNFHLGLITSFRNNYLWKITLTCTAKGFVILIPYLQACTIVRFEFLTCGFIWSENYDATRLRPTRG